MSSDLMQRELILKELMSRMWSIQEENGYPLSVQIVHRNPETASNVFPCVNIFEMDEKSLKKDSRQMTNVGGLKSLDLVFEFWLAAESKESSSVMAIKFYKSLLWAIFKDGATLGGRGEIWHVSTSRILKPIFGDAKVAGMGVTFTLRYLEKLVKII